MASIIAVNELQHTNGTTAATIDSSGYVTKPKLAAFYVYCQNTADENLKTNLTHTIGNTSDFTTVTEYTDTDNCFNATTGEFTAPVNGTYSFSAGAVPANSGGNPRGYLSIFVDDVEKGPRSFYYNLNYSSSSFGVVLTLTANQVVCAKGTGTNSVSTTLAKAHFSGFLIG